MSGKFFVDSVEGRIAISKGNTVLKSPFANEKTIPRSSNLASLVEFLSSTLIYLERRVETCPHLTEIYAFRRAKFWLN